MIYGVAAAIFWGVGDLMAKGVVDRIGSRAALLYVQGGGLTFALIALWLNGVDLALPAWPMLGFLCITVCANALSVGLLYQALARGPAMLAVPLSTCSGAMSLMLSLLTGTAQASLQAILLLLGITGAAMAVAMQPQGRARCWRTATFALSSAAAGGLATWSAGRWIGPPSTAASGALLNMALLTLASYCVSKREHTKALKMPAMLIAGCAVSNVCGYAAFLAGIMDGRLDETGVLCTLSGAVAACGAAVVLRERLSIIQYWGLAATAVLVPLLAAAA